MAPDAVKGEDSAVEQLVQVRAAHAETVGGFLRGDDSSSAEFGEIVAVASGCDDTVENGSHLRRVTLVPNRGQLVEVVGGEL